MIANVLIAKVCSAHRPFVIVPPEIGLFGGVVHEITAISISKHQCPEPLVGRRLREGIQRNLPLFQDGSCRCGHRPIWIDVHLLAAVDVLDGEMTGGLLACSDSTEMLFSPLAACFQFGHYRLSVCLRQKNPCGDSEEPPQVVPKLKVMMIPFVSLGVSAPEFTGIYECGWKKFQRFFLESFPSRRRLAHLFQSWFWKKRTRRRPNDDHLRAYQD